MRARIIRLSRSGLRGLAIAVELGCSQKTVRCRLHRFNRLGLQGLDDLGGNSLSTRTWLEDHPRIDHASIPVGACRLNLREGRWRIFNHALVRPAR